MLLCEEKEEKKRENIFLLGESIAETLEENELTMREQSSTE